MGLIIKTLMSLSNVAASDPRENIVRWELFITSEFYVWVLDASPLLTSNPEMVSTAALDKNKNWLWPVFIDIRGDIAALWRHEQIQTIIVFLLKW